MPHSCGIMRRHGSLHDQRKLEPVRNIKFPKNFRQVSLDRSLGYSETACNLLVAFPIADERCDFILSAGEIGKQLTDNLLDLVLFLRNHYKLIQKMPAKRSPNP